jgi:hypothetical protein
MWWNTLLIEVAADPAGTVDVSVFAQYGILGVLSLGLILFARGAYGRERDRADRLEQENKRLNEAIQERVIPALLSATRAAEESTELLAAMQRERELMLLADQRRMRGSDEVS